MSFSVAWAAPSDAIGSFAKNEGREGMSELGVNLAIAGSGLKMFEDWKAAEDAIEATETSFNEAFEYRKKLFQHGLENYTENARIARDATTSKYSQTLGIIWQHRVRAAEEQKYIMRDARAQQAALMSGAADRGETGPVVDSLMAAIERNASEMSQTVALTEKWGADARMRSLKQIEAEGTSRTMSAMPNPLAMTPVPSSVSTPNLPGQFMGGIAAAFKAKAAYSNIESVT